MRGADNRRTAASIQIWNTCRKAVTTSICLTLLVQATWAGLACLSNPCMFGICIDDVNSTFMCYCIDGYTGIQCQTNWDECWSSPCLNGGECVDGIADFNCTCPDGFQGELCELNINECESNPCHNNGTCVDGSNGYSCICPAGYLGDFCEMDISVCNDTEDTRCMNGGLCVEGPGITFNCICPPGWTGRLCELPVDECASSPCRNGAICLDLHANYTCACPFGYTGRNCEVELEMCGEKSPCQNEALCLIEDWLSVCYCVPDFHGDRCQFQYDECLLGPGCKNGGTCIDGIDQFTCSCPTDLTGDLCECLVINEDETDCNYVRPVTTTLYPPSTTPEETVPTWIETEVPKTSPSTIGSTESVSPFTTPVPDLTTVFLSKTSSEEPTTETTSEDHTTVTKETTWEYTTTSIIHYTPETDITSESFLSSLPATHSSSRLPELESTTDYSTDLTSTDWYSSTQLPVNCKKTPCLNGGMCLNTPKGLRCVCKADWEGPLCDEKAGIKVAAFSGRSHLSHRLTNASKARIDITARTVAPVGTILYAHLGPDVYMSLYLEDGLLKFKFSCGIQTMLLSEVQLHINNGFDLVATVILEFLNPMRNSRHCAATVRINNTLAMSGEQMAREPHTDLGYAWVHIGGVPSKYADTGEAPVLEGFVGCMQNLLIDSKAKSISKDAFDSNDITECMSLACLSNPCYSGSTCIEHNNTWTCLCPNGYLGLHCEQSVCRNNPCEFGGSCVVFPGSGFICLCPLGKHGLFCEHDVEIGHPVFSSSVGGLSSFSAYSLPAEIHENMILTFKFIPHDMEQISVMAFIGQDGYHGPTSDHLAVSFIKGYVVLTWNLGSGPRRIFTTQPVPDTGHLSHVVRVGRIGQKAWLAVDNQGNVTGKSPGRLTQLNTKSILYLGGHDSTNFSLLPHDLPLHTGFSGCLFDVELKAGQMSIMLQKTRAASGRGVGQCGTTLCHEHACENGGGCIHHGATYTCLCADGWFGATCAMTYNPCDHSKHNCSRGSMCVPLLDGYYCDCPLGRSGRYCENVEELSDVKLTGIRSYLSLSADGLHQHQSCIDLEVRPLANQGLLLYSGRRDGGGFWSLSLQGGVLELRVSPGKHRRRGDVLVIRSRRLLALGKWHRIRAGRYGRRLFLWVEGTVNTGVLLPGENLPPSGTLIYIGGVPDLSTLPVATVAGNLIPFHGCVRKFASQWKWKPLNTTNIAEARNVQDCDGTVCGGDVCDHGGTCYVGADDRPLCACTKQYLGEKCEVQVSCKEISCQNGGRCIQEKGLSPRCHCPIGWGGGFCDSAVSVEAPHFGGDSYILIDRASSSTKRRDTNSKVDVNFVYLNFTTAESYGMILWSSRAGDTEFIGIGVEDGLLKLVWAYEGHSTASIRVSDHSVSDGVWHDLAISFDSPNITIWTDHQTLQTTHTDHPDRPLATDGLFYLGGFPEQRDVARATRGHFTSGFSGCLQKLAWSIDSVIINFSSFEGENIGTCDPFEP